jgi:hypothetical protein
MPVIPRLFYVISRISAFVGVVTVNEGKDS